MARRRSRRAAVGHADYEAQIHRFFLGVGAAQGKASGGAISACRPAYVRPIVKAATLNTQASVNSNLKLGFAGSAMSQFGDESV